jgi:hypothetical protein
MSALGQRTAVSQILQTSRRHPSGHDRVAVLGGVAALAGIASLRGTAAPGAIAALRGIAALAGTRPPLAGSTLGENA